MAVRSRRRASEQPEESPGPGTMGFLDHLEELRKRIIRSCLAIAAGMLVAFVFLDRITDFVLAPTYRALPPGSELVFIRPGEFFSFDMSVAFIAGLVIA